MDRNILGGGPGRKIDREFFATLTDREQDRIAARASSLYDGSRTVAQCWKQALDEHDRRVTADIADSNSETFWSA